MSDPQQRNQNNSIRRCLRRHLASCRCTASTSDDVLRALGSGRRPWAWTRTAKPRCTFGAREKSKRPRSPPWFWSTGLGPLPRGSGAAGEVPGPTLQSGILRRVAHEGAKCFRQRRWASFEVEKFHVVGTSYGAWWRRCWVKRGCKK